MLQDHFILSTGQSILTDDSAKTIFLPSVTILELSNTVSTLTFLQLFLYSSYKNILFP